jgi:hypothetical protein
MDKTTLDLAAKGGKLAVACIEVTRASPLRTNVKLRRLARCVDTVWAVEQGRHVEFIYVYILDDMVRICMTDPV